MEKDGAVAINVLKRYVGGFGISKSLKPANLNEEIHEKKVVVVGVGSSGRGDLAHSGIRC